MPVYDLFSKRKKRLRNELFDVFAYDEITEQLRVQIIHIWDDALIDRNDHSQPYKTIVEILRREYGFFNLSGNQFPNDIPRELVYFFLNEKNIDYILDTIELSFQLIDHNIRQPGYYTVRRSYNDIANDAIEELNIRFREHGVGYEYTEGKVVRIDSQLIHAEVVKPALKLLNSIDYAGPQQGFLNAFDHYKKGKTKEAMNDALKAFESTMKTICDKQNWAYNPDKDTSNTLIDICYKNGLIPPFWQDQMKALRKLLESGVPTGRNKMSGHGQGATPKEVPDYMASYILHMTASAIVFLVEAEKAIK